MPLTREQQASLTEKGIDWKRVSYVEANDALDALRASAATLVDARGAGQYDASHFPGAVHGREKERLLALPRERASYLYCTWVDEAAASRAALTLMDAGYGDVHVVVNGLGALDLEAEARGLSKSPPAPVQAGSGSH